MSEQPHYFAPSAAPGTARREITVRITGRELAVATGDGVFSGSRLDPGTGVLLRHLVAPDLDGPVLDLGCGWGPVTLALGLTAPAAPLWAVDVTGNALRLTADNAARHGVAVRTALPDDVPPGLRFAAVWSNPPVRIGKPALHDLLLHWLDRLLPGGTAHLVVQRNLGADPLQAWLAGQLPDHRVARAGSARGYRVITVTAG